MTELEFAISARFTEPPLGAAKSAALSRSMELNNAELPRRDRDHRRLIEVYPVEPQKTLVVGAGGQLCLALRERLNAKGTVFAERADLDIESDRLDLALEWRTQDVIISAAAYAAVDTAETTSGRAEAWRTDAYGITNLARIAAKHDLTLLHVSSDYVFDGLGRTPYLESDPVCQLNVYRQTKAAADFVVSTVPRHYILRTLWVLGEGKIFVKTMASLARRGESPNVVNNQFGRPTVTHDLTHTIQHLIQAQCPFGIYNLTSSGLPSTWLNIARQVCKNLKADAYSLVRVMTENFRCSGVGFVAERTKYSNLDIVKIQSRNFWPISNEKFLDAYLNTSIKHLEK